MKNKLLVFCCLITSGILQSCISDVELQSQVRAIMLADDEREECSKAILDEESTQIDEFICVSLGSNCFTALHLDKNKIRRWSFPFDWNVTSFYGLCNLIEDHFADFVNPAYLCIKHGAPGVYNTKYLTALAHDFPEANGVVSNYRDYIDEIASKYKRRIERFYNVCNLAKTVYFFRIKFSWWKFDTEPYNQQNAVKIRDLLRKTFPKNNWILVCVDTSSAFAHDWKIPQIKNFQIGDLDSSGGWTKIYSNLGLLK